VSARQPDVPEIGGPEEIVPAETAPTEIAQPPVVAGPYEIDRIDIRHGTGDLIATYDVPVGIVPSGEVEGGISMDTEVRPEPSGPIQPVVLSGRQSMWLDRLVSGNSKGEMGRIRRALKDQGWQIVPGTRGKHDRAFPPGVDPTSGWPYVVLPGTIGEGRAVANLVAALRRAGPFRWKGR
jgi:hypothetical protein